MATPSSVRYSPIAGAPAELVPRFAEPFGRLGVHVRQVGRLGLGAEGEMCFAGGEVQCSNLEQALEVALPWRDFAIRTDAEEPFGSAYLYWWWKPPSWRFAAEVESSLVYHDLGDWFRRFLISLMGILRADVCAFGAPYEAALFESLDPHWILELLRSGRLTMTPYPHLHMLSTRLASAEEVKLALANPPPGRLKYQLTSSGYHVVSEL